MYHPAVKRTNPGHFYQESEIYKDRKVFTSNAKEHPGFTQTTRSTISVVEHLEHGAHLLARVFRFVLHYIQIVILAGPVNLDYSVPGVRGIGSENVESQAVFI